MVHTDEPGYRNLVRFAGEASRLVGAYVQVITDDIPAACAHVSFVSRSALLASLARELEAIERLVAQGRAAWEADELLRLAVERRWIAAGNYAERYRIAAGLGVATDPWTELYDYRFLGWRRNRRRGERSTPGRRHLRQLTLTKWRVRNGGGPISPDPRQAAPPREQRAARGLARRLRRLIRLHG